MFKRTKLPPAQWFPNPHDPLQWRWWDGHSWTDLRSPRAVREAEVATFTEVDIVRVGTDDGGARVAQISQDLSVQRVRHAAKRMPTVADVARELQHEPLRHPLDEQVEVAGETFHVKGIKRVFAEVGVPITKAGSTIDSIGCILVPEPWNPHDVNAVAVLVGSHHVGYLPADLAEDYAEALNALAQSKFLATGEARIWALDDAGVIRARVTVLIPEADAFAD